jgi:hydroxymethylglutaryl-CoA reductase (NADPH)
MFVPSLLLKKLYTIGSLENAEDAVRFRIKNRLSDATLTGLRSVTLGGEKVPLDQVALVTEDGETLAPGDLSDDAPLDFPLRREVTVVCRVPALAVGRHAVGVSFTSKPFGKMKFEVEDSIRESDEDAVRIPRDRKDDYSPEAIGARQQFVREETGTDPKHIFEYSYDPYKTQGNVEHLIGVAQVPLGIAGPLTIHGEHAQGDFIIPMATTEGTLVASYNRGMKVVNMSGGAKATVVADAMQRAPVFVFSDAREARDFVKWIDDHIDGIRDAAEGTTSVGKLTYIDPYLANKFAFLRFNYTTGDAAGQNMVGRATFAACSWILDHYDGPPVKSFYLESNFATDKKASQVNIMRTRGKRVTAEVTFKREVLTQYMRVEPEQLIYHYQVAGIGTLLSGANNNGLHSANGITAMFIATGQDVANVSESSAGVLYSELTPEGDLYMSITIPSLIVATYGGGTGLDTQRECLEMLGCYGKGGVHKFAEIVASVVLAGEISLASAISSSDWVSSHEQYGRNR